ncbi:MAG: hypothetical protein RLZZ611_1781 [Cyanobacteriota bacterium]|jgi:hypothetical protein
MRPGQVLWGLPLLASARLDKLRSLVRGACRGMRQMRSNRAGVSDLSLLRLGFILPGCF